MNCKKNRHVPSTLTNFVKPFIFPHNCSLINGVLIYFVPIKYHAWMIMSIWAMSLRVWILTIMIYQPSVLMVIEWLQDLVNFVISWSVSALVQKYRSVSLTWFWGLLPPSLTLLLDQSERNFVLPIAYQKP